MKSLTISILAGTALLLAACGGNGPVATTAETDGLSAQEAAAENYRQIYENANHLLYGNRVGYGLGTVHRTPVVCNIDTCAVDHLYSATTEGFRVSEDQISFVPRGEGLPITVEDFGDDETYEGNAYGGWMDHSFFVVQVNRSLDPRDPLIDIERAGAYATGNTAFSNPTVSGTARWDGFMVGNDYGAASRRNRIVHGDSTITVRMGDQITADVAFTNITELHTMNDRPSMAWTGLTVSKGGFAYEGGVGDTLQGQFYGPGHEEMAGIFERSSIIGAFGGQKSPR